MRENEDRESVQDVIQWSPGTAFDHGIVRVYTALHTGLRWLVFFTAAIILVSILTVTSVGSVAEPTVFALVALSIVPAVGLFAFIYFADVGTREPLSVLSVTFLLGVSFAGFAAVLNALGLTLLEGLPIVSWIAFFYLVSGPAEEGVKLLAVRLFAYRDRRFDAVIDGAIYGGVAGLGFATIENALYITDAVAAFSDSTVGLALGGETAALRALTGPGHVIYSAIAGYYLGLAKFNRRYAGPLVLKGLTLAAVIHATYNVGVQAIPGTIAAATGVSLFGAVVAFIVVYDGLAAYYLYRKLARYRRAHTRTRNVGGNNGPELTEFDP